ncbi:MAG: hypothetical protein FWD23_14690 [Oscillospiraceae bacterium]|nr:hypothetical protein [Oscillospiraceae bacterium]
MKIKKIILPAFCAIILFSQAVSAEAAAWKTPMTELLEKFPSLFDEETKIKNNEMVEKYWNSAGFIDVSDFSSDVVFPDSGNIGSMCTPVKYFFYDLDFDGIPEVIIDYGGIASGMGWREVYKFYETSYEQITTLSGGEYYEYLYINPENKIVSVNSGSTRVFEIKNRETVYSEYTDSTGSNMYEGIKYSEIGVYSQSQFFNSYEKHLTGEALGDLTAIVQFDCSDVLANIYSPKTSDNFVVFCIIFISVLIIFSAASKYKKKINIALFLVVSFILALNSCADNSMPEAQVNEMINRINEYYAGMKYYKGISMRTEFDVYSPDTMRILVYWENNSNMEASFGEPWQLYKKQGGEFVPVIRTSGDNYGWHLPAYPVGPKTTRQHVYWVKPFTDELTPGTYMIKTDFRGDETCINYLLETEFEVSEDKTKQGKSALDFLNGENETKYRDITGGGWGFTHTFGNTYFRLYKHNKTYDAILTDGIHEYEIAKGSGKWGITNNLTYEADSRIYLVYAYSGTVGGKNSSYLCVLDISDNSDVKEVYKSEPFYNDRGYIVGFSINAKLEEREDGYQYAVLDEDGNFVIDNKFAVFWEEWYEYEGGGLESALVSYTGWIVYENGKFFYLEE